jgi:hypothetical protein
MLPERQTTNRPMSLQSELESLGQNAIKVSCASARLPRFNKNCVHLTI